MTHLYKIGLKETQLVTVLQENIDERPGFTLVPVKYEQCKMKVRVRVRVRVRFSDRVKQICFMKKGLCRSYVSDPDFDMVRGALEDARLELSTVMG